MRLIACWIHQRKFEIAWGSFVARCSKVVARVDQFSNEDAVEEVLSSTQSGANQRFFAAGFFRLLTQNPEEVHGADSDSRLGVMRLLEKLPRVAKALDVDQGLQGFERARAFEAASQQAVEHLTSALQGPRQLEPFDQV